MFAAFPRNSGKAVAEANRKQDNEKAVLTDDTVSMPKSTKKRRARTSSNLSANDEVQAPTEEVPEVLPLSELGIGLVKDGKNWRTIELLENEKMSTSTKLLG